jgi:amidase
LPPERRSLIDPTVLDWMDQGRAFSADELAEAERRRPEIAAWFIQKLEGIDVLLIATTIYWAPRFGETEMDLGTEGVVRIAEIAPGWLTSSVNVAGLPAVNVPAGQSTGGAPFGVSFVAGANQEGLLLELAARWEELAGYRPSQLSPQVTA